MVDNVDTILNMPIFKVFHKLESRFSMDLLWRQKKYLHSARFFSRQNTREVIGQFYKITKGSMRALIGFYANPRLRLGIAQLSRILPTTLAFISVYANIENVFYCLSRPQR